MKHRETTGRSLTRRGIGLVGLSIAGFMLMAGGSSLVEAVSTCDLGGPVPSEGHHTLLAVSGQSVAVDGSPLFSGTCASGSLQYRFTNQGIVVQDWSTNPVFTTAVSASVQYTVQARCSTSIGCTASNTTIVVAHTPLGNATLSMQADGHLLISNIGSSGLDGARIDLGGLPTLVGHLTTVFDEPNFGVDSPTGASQVVTTHANVPGGVLCRLTLLDVAPGTLEVRPEIPAAAPTLYNLTVLDGTTINGTFGNLSAATIQTSDCMEVEVD